jgi:hypothetical protein
MKYIDALKKYNEGKDKWCTPRKGSVDYLKIRKMMKEIASAASASPKKASASPKKASASPKKASAFAAVIISSSKKPSTKSLLFNNAKIIQRFLKKKLVLTKHNLDTRIQRYHLIKKRLDSIPDTECLTKKMFGKNKGYTLNGVVNLEKKMGSSSLFGSVYLSSIPNLLGSYPIASKIMKTTHNHECETQLNEWITKNIIIPKQSRHFVMMYKNTKCSVAGGKANQLVPAERLVNYNELCNGDLIFLMKTNVRNDEMDMINIAFQSLIAIATYQKRIGFCHRDCHSGNFLYQIDYEVYNAKYGAGSGNSRGNVDYGYYHYVYNGFHFYLKRCSFNICIFDFGLSVPMNTAFDESVCSDYLTVLKTFISREDYGWIAETMDMDISADMASLLAKVRGITKEFLSDDVEYAEDRIDIFQEIIERVFKVFRTDTGIFRTKKPAKVLNKVPFVINKVSPYPDIKFKRDTQQLRPLRK